MDIQRGVVRAYDSTNHVADVLVYGSMSRVILGVPVSHSIGAELMAVGADCGVVVFSPGDTGVVVCTFTGAPDPWVTSALIKDAEIVKADLAWDPTVYTAMHHTAGDLTLTQTPTWYANLGSHTVTVPDGKTIRVVLMASVVLYCTAYTAGNFDRVQIYKDGVGMGQPLWARVWQQYAGSSLTPFWTEDLTATATFKVYCHKINNLNTERADRGNFMVQYWEVPS